MMPQTDDGTVIQELNQAPVPSAAPAPMDPLSYNNQLAPSPVAYGNGASESNTPGQSVFRTASQTTTVNNPYVPLNTSPTQPKIMPLPNINMSQPTTAVVPASAVMR
jgi:hypothetical protein